MPIRRWLSAWLVLAMLFVQFASAAYACPRSGNAQMAPCAMSMADSATLQQLDPDQPGLCIQHCQAPSQALDQGHAPSVPAAVAIATLIVDVVPLADGVAWTTHGLRRDRTPPPAHSILHCCHRI